MMHQLSEQNLLSVSLDASYYEADDTGRKYDCLLYTSDAADDLLCVDLGGRRIIKKKKRPQHDVALILLTTNQHDAYTFAPYSHYSHSYRPR